MLLAIDCGNTNTVFALWDGDAFVATWRTSTEQSRTADQYFVWLTTLMSACKVDATIDQAIISSTVPRVVFNLRVMCNRYFGCRPLVVGKVECALPVAARVDPGTNVGPDRLVNTAGAFDRHGGDVIVVDFGTATTFDVVDAEGAYCGGVIAPGVNTSLEALHLSAAALPHVDITLPSQVIGRNTVDCMQSGIYWGYVGLIREIIGRIQAERGVPMRVVATGGLAPLFQQSDALFDVFDESLTIHGLTVINTHNRKADPA